MSTTNAKLPKLPIAVWEPLGEAYLAGAVHDEVALAIRTLRKTKTAAAKTLLENTEMLREILTVHLGKYLTELIEIAMINFTRGGYNVDDFAK